MPKNLRFWTNVALIAFAHILVIVGLIRWSRESKNASAQSVVWLNGGGGDGLVTEKKNLPAPLRSPLPRKESKTDPLKERQPDEARSYLASAPSDIQLPTPRPSPKPAPTATPPRSPKPSPTAKAKTTPKPTPKPTSTASPARTPKKIVMAKASPKPSPTAKPTPEKKESEQAIARPRKKKSRRRLRRRTIPPRRNQRNLQLLRPVAARGPRLATTLVAPAGPVLNRNSVGTAACCTTAFIANGSNRRRSQRRDQEIPCS